MTRFHADFEDIRRLEADLAKAEATIATMAGVALSKIVPMVAAEARANAASFGGTGELASSIEFDTSGLTRRVTAPVRQAFFLEYGSPNTGAPRPWLTAPAERGAENLAAELGRVGGPW